MKRFLVFPVVIGVAGALATLLTWLEGYAAQWTFLRSIDIYWHLDSLANSVARQMAFSALAGFIVGVGLALWDMTKNQRDEDAAKRILPNSFWCLLYVSLFIGVNCLLSNFICAFYSKSFQYAAGPEFFYLMKMTQAIFWGALILNFTAILWAAIRSITTDDVLTPRVLRDKLRERARLQ